MSGHSKWANIKNKKGAADAKRANVFTKIGREIAVAVKAGGPDPNTNAKLANVIAKAKAANMPNDNIERGIKKASGALDAVNYEENVYEGYAPGGVAVIVKTLTDNKNRTASEIRHHFDKCGGNLGTSGCVSYMFDSKGVIVVETALSEDDVMMLALDAGAEDVILNEAAASEIYTAPNDLDAVAKAIEADKSVKVLSAEQDMIPSNTVKLDEATEAKVKRLLDMLEESDDVQDVYHNAELTEEPEED